MRTRTLSAVAVVFFLFAGVGIAQESSNVKIQNVPVTPTSPASGKDMYVNYCASCHGKDGKGNGPAAPALKSMPTDLTALGKKNGGKFPADHVAAILAGAGVTAHGSADMPVWGTLFRRVSSGHQAEVQLRISNMTKYLESIQAN